MISVIKSEKHSKFFQIKHTNKTHAQTKSYTQKKHTDITHTQTKNTNTHETGLSSVKQVSDVIE